MVVHAFAWKSRPGQLNFNPPTMLIVNLDLRI